MRPSGRAADAIRAVVFEINVNKYAEGSCLVHFGDTQVLCTATVEQRPPPWMRDSGRGWITAEYGMLPCATHSRGRREAVSGRSGRTFEIQRLIGRSLRMMIDLHLLGEYTLRVDCDVINADGGTRCAAITGSALALRQALAAMVTRQQLASLPPILPVAAVSVGVVAGRPLLDLDYAEDSSADVDANFVMSGDGRWIEVQTTAEGAPFRPELFTAMVDLAEKGVKELLGLWEGRWDGR
jgi:ribonuclease PH